MSIAEKLTAIAENETKVYEAWKKAEWQSFITEANKGNWKFAFV